MTQEPFEPGLDTSDARSPLQHIKGRLQEYIPVDRPDNRGGTYKQIQFKFVDMETIKSLTPYPHPVGEIFVSYSTSTGTKWGALAGSYRKLAPDAQDLKGLVGKMQEWKMVPTKRRGPLSDEAGNPQMDESNQRVWGEVTEDMWVILSVEGLGSAEEMDKDFNEYIDGLADGKSDKDFYAAALTDEKVRKHPDVVTAITDRKYVETMLAAGRLTQDDKGILHKAV